MKYIHVLHIKMSKHYKKILPLNIILLPFHIMISLLYTKTNTSNIFATQRCDETPFQSHRYLANQMTTYASA